MNSPICLPGSVLAEVDGLAGATEPAVVVLEDAKKKRNQKKKQLFVLNMCFVLPVYVE